MQIQTTWLKQGWLQFTLIMMAMSLLLAGQAQAADMVPVRSITVNGMAKRQVVPDEAHLTVNLNAMEPKLTDAKDAHDKKLKKLMAIVSDAGIDKKKVRTQYSNIQPVYEYRRVKVSAANPQKSNCVSSNGIPCPPPIEETKSVQELQGYRVQTTVDITVGDTSKTGNLIDAVTKAEFEKGAKEEWGWGNLTSVYYTLSNPEKIRDEMLAEAIANAKDKATKMASAAGASVVSVYQINESGAPSFDFPRPMMMREFSKGIALAAAPPSEPSMAPPAGEQEVNASVTVMFELK